MKNIYYTSATVIFFICENKTKCPYPHFAGLLELFVRTGGLNWKNNTGWKKGIIN